MNVYEFQKEALRTDCTSLSNPQKLEHYIAGVNTEINELVDIYKKQLAYNKAIDFAHYKEEVGDICWYLANLANLLGIDLLFNFTQSNYNLNSSIRLFIDDSNIFYLLNNVSHFNKVFIGLRHSIKRVDKQLIDRNGTPLQNSIVMMFKVLQNLLSYHGQGYLEQCLDINVAKRKLRYPELFDANKALNRDVNAEYEEILKLSKQQNND